MLTYKNKYNFLTDEIVKANNELVDNENFAVYMDEERDTVTLYEGIIRALVKTIKFYEQADHKLNNAVTQRVEDARQELATNEVFKEWLDFYLNGYTININEATTLALPKAIWQLDHSIKDAEKTIRELQDRLLEIDDLKEQLSETKELLKKTRKETNVFRKANLDITKELNKTYDKNEDLQGYIHKLKTQIEDEQLFAKDKEQTCYRLSEYNTKLERENMKLKEQNEDLEEEKRVMTNNLNARELMIEGTQMEIEDISALYNEQVDTIKQRDNEIDALKHMLDRKDVD